MPKFAAREWATRIRQCSNQNERDQLIGVSTKLAARLLGVCRSRVRQLVKSGKLRVVEVYDERGTRIGNLVTMASIDRRRCTVRPRHTAWKPGLPGFWQTPRRRSR